MQNSKFRMQNSNLKLQENSQSPPSTPYPPLPASKRGFTLVELIISITIIGIIVLMAGSAMRVGFRSVSAGEKKMESLERVRASLSIIDSQIQSEIPLTIEEEDDWKSYFTGDGDSLQFATNYSMWDRQKGYVLVSYRVVSDEHGKKALYVSENIIGLEDKRETKLLDGFDAIYFEYFYRDLLDEKNVKWIKQWKDELIVTEKVKLNLEGGGGTLSFIFPTRVKSLETL